MNRFVNILSVPEFRPRKTSSSFVFFNLDIALVPGFIFWGFGAYLMYEFILGSPWHAALLLPIWTAIGIIFARWLHLAGRVRMWVSLGSTAVVLLASAFVLLQV